MPHIRFMDLDKRDQEALEPEGAAKARKPRSVVVRTILFWVGVLLVIVSPLVGAIPGPGGIIVFAAGFGMMLRGSHWVKKKYARFKRVHPKKGDWADFGLQRASYRRRQARLRAQMQGRDALDGRTDPYSRDRP